MRMHKMLFQISKFKEQSSLRVDRNDSFVSVAHTEQFLLPIKTTVNDQSDLQFVYRRGM